MTTAELLRKAADALDDGIDPFSGSFLRENNVSSDQCGALTDMLAIGARMVADGIEEPNTMAGRLFLITLTRHS